MILSAILVLLLAFMAGMHTAAFITEAVNKKSLGLWSLIWALLSSFAAVVFMVELLSPSP